MQGDDVDRVDADQVTNGDVVRIHSACVWRQLVTVCSCISYIR